jgi:hypothetical protein
VVANCGSGHLEDPADVAFAEVNARERRQLRWRDLSGRPALSSRAERIAIHLEVAALTYSRLLPRSVLDALQAIAYPMLAIRTLFSVR